MDDLRSRARAALKRHLGYPDFRPGQIELVEAVLAGRDALGILPTGGGKSVTYQVPAALLEGVTLVVSPLISLMADQVNRCNEVGIPAAHLSSTLPPGEGGKVADGVEAGRIRVLFVSPERFRTPGFRLLLERVRVALMAVDEAHCISQWGHDFRPDYLRLGEARALVQAPVLAVTATATPRVREEIVRELRLRNPVVVVRSFDRPNLSWSVDRVGTPREKLDRLHRRLLGGREGVAVVYAATRKGVEGIRDRLAGFGWRAEAYHAGLPAGERSRVQGAFMAGEARVVVATNAFGMGIDKPDVRLVAHVEVSGSLEAYYQEAGRAGRDGGPGLCTALFAPGDLSIHEGFLERSHPDLPRIRRVWRALEEVMGRARVAPVPLDVLALRAGLVREEGVLLSCLRKLEAEGALRAVEEGGLPREEGELRGPDGRAALPSPVLQRMGSGAPRLEGARAARDRERSRLEAVAGYLLTRHCRRAFLLGYFGERAEVPCGRCDLCGGRPPL
jgi:ATP-dependent DNA helicase RecQ